MTEWSLANQLEFQNLRVEECDRLFSDLINKLCSPDRVNEAAQIALYEEAKNLNNRIDMQTESIQKLLEEVNKNGVEQDLSIVDIWGRKIPEQKKALANIGNGLQAIIQGQGVDLLEEAVNCIDFQLLEMEKLKFDKSTFSPITFEYLRDRFDHCLSLLQNIFNFFLRRHMDQNTANEQMNLIRRFNSDFELQKQNIRIYEKQLFESLSFQNGDGTAIENQLNLLSTFAETIDIWTKLPLNQISDTKSSNEDMPLQDNLYELFKNIDYEKTIGEQPTNSELVTLKLNLRFFRPKFSSKKLVWIWINKLKLKPKEEEEGDSTDYERQIPKEAISDYYLQLQQFMENTETSIDTFIENLLTCEPNREYFDKLFEEFENLKSLLKAQRPQIKAMKKELSQILTEESITLEMDDDVIILNEDATSSSNNNHSIMYNRVNEWIQLVDIWQQVLDSLTGLLSHMTKSANHGQIDDAVDSLRQMIERDLFIPQSDNQNDMEQ